MPLDESRYPDQWLRIGERDLARVERCLRDEDPEAAGFFLQQGLEKSLKAFLLSRGWRLRRIHDLAALLDDAVKHDPALERFRPLCQQVTGYYLIEQYPLVGASAPAEAEVRTALQASRELLQQITNAIQG